MTEAGKVAIATLVMRNKEYLVAIRPEADALALAHDVLRRRGAVTRTRARRCPTMPSVSDRELAMAQLLIASMESDWDPSGSTTPTGRRSRRSSRRSAGPRDRDPDRPEPAPTKVVDLMEALNASIAAAARAGGRRAGASAGRSGHKAPRSRPAAPDGKGPGRRARRATAPSLR